MAIIGKIRSKSGWIVSILGLALLAFTFDVWKDLLPTSCNKKMGMIAGTVNGEDVDMEKFEALRRYQDIRYRFITGLFIGKAQSPVGKEAEFWYDEAWRRFTDSIVLAKEFEALGIHVSEKELNAYFNATNGFKGLPDLVSLEGNPQRNGQPQQIIPSVFKDYSTGTYTQQSIAQGKDSIKNWKANDEKFWEIVENDYKQFRAREKYMQLLTQGIYTTKIELEDRVESKSTTKNISYLVKKFDEIPNEQVKPSESELKAYYELHKNDVKYSVLKASREIRYVAINIVPSAKDSSVFNSEIAKIKEAWAKAKSDSTFVMQNSDSIFYFNDKRATAVPEENEKAQMGYQTFPAGYDAIFKTAKTTSIV
ncbi:MAG: SurA N-terminal domain-containing protein, partial [Bacteroidetes bacterium]|nr:SurA N-terminal domain-containing protein [Bacteroidota bacterium]